VGEVLVQAVVSQGGPSTRLNTEGCTVFVTDKASVSNTTCSAVQCCPASWCPKLSRTLLDPMVFPAL